MSVDMGYHEVLWKMMMAIRIAKRAKLRVGVFTVDSADSGKASSMRPAAVFDSLLPASVVLVSGGEPSVEAPVGERSTVRGFGGLIDIPVRGTEMKRNNRKLMGKKYGMLNTHKRN